jgi:hypothetical protein
MYGLPSDFDPQIFVGRELEAVTYAVNVIVLAFTPQLTVSVSGSAPDRPTQDRDALIDRAPVAESELVSIVGDSVVTVELKSPRELILELARGGEITLLDDEDMYECYLINTGDREIVV